jgi:hypothetical protein
MKKIEPKMVEFLDGKLAGNGLFQMALANKDARIIFRLAAQACVGIRETGGNNSGPMVELIQETIGGHSKEAWCMSFVQTCLAYAELKTGLVSPVFMSEGCAQVWAGTDKKQRVKLIPAPGAIIIWGHYDKKGKYLGGHTGVVDSVEGRFFYAFEGNTTGGLTGNDKVIRDGGGCYYTKRRFAGDGNMKVRGFIKPF